MLIKDGQKIVFAGDSVTDCGRKRPIGEGLWEGVGNGYVRFIDSYLAAEYPAQTFRCVNMGCGGNTSTDLLDRWDTDITALNPDWVVLLIGINDVWRQFDSPAQTEDGVSPEVFRKNLNEMADKTQAKMIWMTPYFLEPNENDAMRKRTDEYGAIVKEEAQKRNIPCIDLQQEFSEILKYRHSSFIGWDRVHPGWTGGMIIARAFLKFIGAA